MPAPFATAIPIIAAALSDAVKTGLLAKNPATHAAPPSARAARAPEQPFWTHEQLAIFLKAAEDHELWPLWRTAALTGMRRGELCGLRWSDIDLHGDELAPGRIRVAQQYTSDGYGVHCTPVNASAYRLEGVEKGDFEPWMSSLRLAKGEGVALFSEDLALRNLARGWNTSVQQLRPD